MMENSALCYGDQHGPIQIQFDGDNEIESIAFVGVACSITLGQVSGEIQGC